MTHWHPQTFYVSVCLCVVVQISCNHSPLRHTHAHTHKYTHAPLPPSAPRGTGRARSRMVPSVEQVFFCDVLTSTACCHFRFKWMSQIEHTHIYKLSVFSSPSEVAETRWSKLLLSFVCQLWAFLHILCGKGVLKVCEVCTCQTLASLFKGAEVSAA